MPTPTQDQCDALALELEQIIAGKSSLDTLLGSPGPHTDALWSCFHGLQHYLADEDIRRKDPWYRDMQESEMRLLVQLLRNGASAERISKIDFLSPTVDTGRE